MIKVFGQTDRDFSSNGDVVIQPKKAIVHKVDNGDYYLDLVTGLEYIDAIVEGNIVVADTPQGEQAFRITNPEKTRTKITTQAKHVSYDAERYIVPRVSGTGINCNAALTIVNDAVENSPFSVSSDVQTVNDIDFPLCSLSEAISGLIDLYGGHLVRDNFSLSINTEIGQDNGITVRYKKNLKDITCTEKWDDVVTRLYPVGKDGIMLNSVDESEKTYIDADISYAIPYTRTVTFSQDINERDYETNEEYMAAAVADLKSQAEAYIAAHSKPEVNYTLKANLEKVTDVGDTVEVIDERLGINLCTHVISYEYDSISHRYTELEFGNFKTDIKNLFKDTRAQSIKAASKAADEVTRILSNDLREATAKIWSVMGDSYVMYDGDKVLVVDKLPKEEATNCILINSAGIGYSNTGINGTFTSAWTIDGTMDMSKIKVINFIADMITAGTIKDKTGKSFWNLDTGVFQLANYSTKDEIAATYVSQDAQREWIRINAGSIDIGAEDGNITSHQDGDSYEFLNKSNEKILELNEWGIDTPSAWIHKQLELTDTADKTAAWAIRAGKNNNLNDLWIGKVE